MIWIHSLVNKKGIPYIISINCMYTDCNNNVSRMLNLFVLLYAYDTVIMGENECGMQRNLNLLNEYCNSFVKAKKILHDKASKAMYSLIQKARRLKLPTDIMLKLFDSCVAPILLYGCEVWGYENTDIIEKVHTKFCKFIFGVSKCSHNYANIWRARTLTAINHYKTENGMLLD